MKNSVTVKTIKAAFIDKRGTITDLLNRDIAHVGLIVTAKGAVRASHYHRKSHQYSYILSGAFEVLTAPRSAPGRIKRYVVKASQMISIAPGIIHRFLALSKAEMVDMISLSRAGNAFEDDVVRVPLVDGVFVLRLAKSIPEL